MPDPTTPRQVGEALRKALAADNPRFLSLRVSKHELRELLREFDALAKDHEALMATADDLVNQRDVREAGYKATLDTLAAQVAGYKATLRTLAAQHSGALMSTSLSDCMASLAQAALRLRAGPPLPQVMGVSRDAECSKALAVFFRREPTDDEMRALHDLLRKLGGASG